MKRIHAVMFFLLIVVTAVAQEAPVQLKVLCYNLRFGELATLQQLGEYIKSENPDVVMLQEVDVFTNRDRAPLQNGKNFISELGYYTGMLSAYSKSISYAGGYYGIGILSKYPFVSTERILLPLVEEKREQRSLLIARVELNNTQQITVACTHLDLKSNIRMVQVNAINNVLKKEKNPVILAGDFNAKPDSPEIKEGMKNWKHSCADDVYTIPVKEPKAKIDYIFSYPQSRWNVVSSSVGNVTLSDHLPVIATLSLISK